MNTEELSELISGCQANERCGQQKLYKLFYADMFRVCRQYANDQHDALTILNDAFLKVFKSIAHYQPSAGSIHAWIKTITINTAIDHTRKLKRKPPVINIELINEQGNDDSRLLTEWKQEELSRHFQLLPNITRNVLNLFAIDGLSHKDISEQLNIAETTSRWHLSEARKRLKISLQLKR